MAAEVEAPAMVSTRRLEGTLVAPRASKAVPNHLADTKIFAKVSKNGLLETQPAVIHFDGYRTGEMHQQTLRIMNSSKNNQQMHIIPPTTPFFSIKYAKQRSRLVPGLSLDVTVQFKPTEWRYYYDCIRVHCKGEQNLLVPIHAYPVMNTAKFPRSVKFPSTPVGQSRARILSLECDVPIDFEFQLTYLQSHPAFTVHPMKGIVPANGKVDISVTFAPTEFNTAIMKLQLELSQFNSTPLTCTVIGSSSPGLAVDQLRRRSSQPRPDGLPSKSQPRPDGLPSKSHPLPPLERRRQRRGETKPRRVPSNTTIPSKVEEEIYYEGIRFPANLETPTAVGKVLAQQPGRLRASELRQVASQTDTGLSSRQMKEAAFLQQVRQDAAEERVNQLRWVTNLGSVAMTMEEKEAILQARQEADTVYQRHCHTAVPVEEYSRLSTECVYRRTRRRAGERPAYEPHFDPYCNDLWQRRHLVLQRFVQAGRRVIVQLRTQHRLERVRRAGEDLRAGRLPKESLADISGKNAAVIPVTSRLPKTADNIILFSFPKYTDTSKPGDMAPEALGTVKVKPTAVEVKKEVPFVDLKVPQQYKLLGYSPHLVPADGSYIPPGLPRHLRTGAEDELQSLGPIPGVDPTFLTPNALLAPSELPPSMTEPLSSLKEPTGVEIQVQDMEGVGEGEEGCLPLVPPHALFKPEQRHPLHIFNPTPGVRHYVSMLPHSEVTLDHILLPLPPYPSAKHPQVKLDPQDVIPGVMRWRQFPSHCLVALEGGRKLCTQWKPRWSDPFSEDLLPHLEPQLLSGPQPDDFVTENSTELIPVPTPEMIRAQFYVPDSSTLEQDERLAAKEKLASERLQQFDSLGQRIRGRLQAMGGHLEEPRMRTVTEEEGERDSR